MFFILIVLHLSAIPWVVLQRTGAESFIGKTEQGSAKRVGILSKLSGTMYSGT